MGQTMHPAADRLDELRDLILLALDATDPDTLTAQNLADARHALIEALDIVEGQP